MLIKYRNQFGNLVLREFTNISIEPREWDDENGFQHKGAEIIDDRLLEKAEFMDYLMRLNESALKYVSVTETIQGKEVIAAFNSMDEARTIFDMICEAIKEQRYITDLTRYGWYGTDVIKSELLKFIQNHKDGVSFAEIEGKFESVRFDYKGNQDVCRPDHNGIVWWQGWNKDAIKILFDLLLERKIHRVPANPTTDYINKGNGLSLKLFVSYNDIKPNEKQWEPLLFKPGEKEH